MARVGYARTSTHGQKTDTQITDLEAAGCGRIFTDHGVSGKHAARPQLDACLAYLREGDTLVITRLSRAMRSIRHMIQLAADLEERGIGLLVLHQDIDTSTPTGRLLFHIIAAIDEWQRELIVEGTQEGLAVARASGKVLGRRPKLSPEDMELVLLMRDAGKPVSAICKRFSIGRTTYYDALRAREKAGAPA